MNYVLATIIVIIILFFIIFHLTIYNGDPVKENIKNIKFKTGDLILFHPLDNMNPVKIMSYYTHVGIVINDEKNKPRIFEILNTKNINGNFSESGFMVSDLEQRIYKYKGYCFHKPLNRDLGKPEIEITANFVEYAEKNFKYDYDYRGYLFGLLVNTPDSIMNCGELVYLWLIKIGLLSRDCFYKRCYHLKYVCNLSELENGYKYENPVLIVYDTF